ncbi:MAG TPA: hypothetical protein VFR15_06725 [Chloroflexia bacterium]|nr:hypothetical protein [Chloroflexia bacterium]
MKQHALAVVVALAAIGCAPPTAQAPSASAHQRESQVQYVIVADNRTQAPVYVHYTPGPGGGAPYIVDMVGPAQRKTLPMPESKGTGGGTFSARTMDGKPAGNVRIQIERAKAPAARQGS